MFSIELFFLESNITSLILLLNEVEEHDKLDEPSTHQEHDLWPVNIDAFGCHAEKR